MEQKLYISQQLASQLPAMVRNELAKMPAQKQQEFVEEYERKAKSTGFGYLFWFLFGLHYAYVGKWGLQVIYWLTVGGIFIWMIADIFRMSRIIGDYNKEVATETMRNLVAISSKPVYS